MPRSLIRRLYVPLAIALLLAGCKDRDDVTDEGVEEPAVAAPDALRTRIDAAISYTAGQRLMNTRDQAAWQIVHGLEAFGRKLEIESDGEVVGALDYLFKGNPLKGWVLRPGDKFPDGTTGVVAILEPGSKTGEGHPDQWLGYLSQCGDVQLDDALVVGGTKHQVRDLLTQAQWDIYDGVEASWTLMAVATYLPLDAKWQAKSGKDDKDRQWSVERLVRMEAAQPLGAGGCFGSHRLYALALAVNRYQKETGKTCGAAHRGMAFGAGTDRRRDQKGQGVSRPRRDALDRVFHVAGGCSRSEVPNVRRRPYARIPRRRFAAARAGGAVDVAGRRANA